MPKGNALLLDTNVAMMKPYSAMTGHGDAEKTRMESSISMSWLMPSYLDMNSGDCGCTLRCLGLCSQQRIGAAEAW